MNLLNPIKSFFSTPTKSNTRMFAFGDPEPILDGGLQGDLSVLLDSYHEYYSTPVDFSKLGDIMGANAYHGSILHFKKNMVLKWFDANALLSRAEMRRLSLDLEVTGNGYLKIFRNRFGHITRLHSVKSIYMRRGKSPEQFFKLGKMGEKTEFKRGEILHVKNPDIKQDIYGLPDYMGGLQSVLLSEESTLFRRKYYLNGAHMGYILVTNDADLDDDTAKKLEDQVRSSKGPGNFRSLFLNIGRSQSKEPVKVIPVGDIGTKDEYERIKNVTQTEMLAMHRMRPELAGIIPQNTGGFGDPDKTMKVYHELEVTAMQAQYLEINERLGIEVVRFKEPSWAESV